MAIAGTLVLAVALASRFGVDPSLVASPLIGEPAPEAVLPRLDNEGELDLTELRDQVVVVNFWASWCVACRAEHDDLVATASAFQDRGVGFVGVVYQDNPLAARRFLDELGWGDNYEYVFDPSSRVAISFGVFGVPETFFIDPEGIVVGKITGGIQRHPPRHHSGPDPRRRTAGRAHRRHHPDRSGELTSSGYPRPTGWLGSHSTLISAAGPSAVRLRRCPAAIAWAAT